MNESLLSQHMDSPGDGYAMEVNSSTTQSNENFTTTTNVFNESSSFIELDSLDLDDSSAASNVLHEENYPSPQSIHPSHLKEKKESLSPDHRLRDYSTFYDHTYGYSNTNNDVNNSIKGRSEISENIIVSTSSSSSSSSSPSVASITYSSTLPITTSYLVPSEYTAGNLPLHFARLHKSAFNMTRQVARKNHAHHQELVLKLLEVKHLLRHEYTIRDRHNRLKRSKGYKFQQHLDSTYTTPKQRLLDRMLLYPEHFNRTSTDGNENLTYIYTQCTYIHIM